MGTECMAVAACTSHLALRCMGFCEDLLQLPHAPGVAFCGAHGGVRSEVCRVFATCLGV